MALGPQGSRSLDSGPARALSSCTREAVIKHHPTISIILALIPPPLSVGSQVVHLKSHQKKFQLRLCSIELSITYKVDFLADSFFAPLKLEQNKVE